MKYATLSKSLFAVTAVLIAAACANSADVPATTESNATEPPPAAPKLPPATPTTPPPPEEKKCAPSCTTDSDCASSCPALAGGVQCCDTKTNTCWGSKTSSCPKPVDADAGDPPPAY